MDVLEPVLSAGELRGGQNALSGAAVVLVSARPFEIRTLDQRHRHANSRSCGRGDNDQGTGSCARSHLNRDPDLETKESSL